MIIKKGDVFMADLGWGEGSEQGGIRPVVVLQNDVGNRYSNTVIVAPTSSQHKPPIPTHITVYNNEGGLWSSSIILLEQIRTIDKQRLTKFIGHLSDTTMAKVDEGILRSFGITQ